ncbi:10598_t:CDS:1, partial [Ambispora leptoticha]
RFYYRIIVNAEMLKKILWKDSDAALTPIVGEGIEEAKKNIYGIKYEDDTGGFTSTHHLWM